MGFDPFNTEVAKRPARKPSGGPSDPRDFTWITDSKKKRAQKRFDRGAVASTGPDSWIVSGDDAMGDKYPEYEVTRVGKKHECECASHKGGEFRSGLCTHSLAVMIHTYEGSKSWKDDNSNQAKSSGSKKTSTETPNSSQISTENLIQNLADLSQQPKKKRQRKPRPVVSESSVSITIPSSSTSTSTPAKATTVRVAGVPRTDVPGNWPSWLSEFRPHQVEAAKEIVEAFENVDVVFFDGPTGSGKSLIAWMVAQMLGVKRSVLLTQDKALQDQYLADFQEVGARTIKGRANYTPQIATDPSGIPVTCDDCNFTAEGCSFCPQPEGCSYRSAKRAAIEAPLGVLNYSYFIREASSARAQFSNQDFIVADECDVLENVLLGAAEVTYSSNLRMSLNLGQPAKLDDPTGHAYVSWLQDIVLPKLEAEHRRIKDTLAGVERTRRIKRSQSKIDETINLISTMMDDGDLNWVLTGYKPDARKKIKEGAMTFKPVRVGEYGNQMLWRHGRKFLLMSATIVSAGELADSLGYTGPWEMIQAPMPFEVDRRLINYIPMARLTRKTEVEATPKIVEGVLKVLERWPEERAIVHTVSYNLTETMKYAIMKGSSRKVFTYRNSGEKDYIIDQFQSTPGAVLVGPSIGRGTDFKGDKARINIICKMPWPSLGDAQVKARRYTKGGDVWYVTKAVREIVQASGRTTRSEDDWGVTYILDASIGSVLKENKFMFPIWFREALRQGKPSTLLEGRALPEPNFK